jgi:Domain of unknown function (DUF4249)
MQFDFNNSSYVRILVLLTLTCGGCNDEFIFTGEADDKRIVAVVFGEEDSTINMQLRSSQFITEDTAEIPIPFAEIRLYKQDQFTEFLTSATNGNATSQYKVKAHDSLRFVMRKDGYNLVEGRAVVPGEINLLQFDTTTRLANQLGLRLSFLDLVTDNNYYLIEMHAHRWIYILDPFTQERIDSNLIWESLDIQSVNKIFFSDQNIVTNEQKFELFNDQIFNGENFVLDVNINALNLQESVIKGRTSEIKVRLRNINEDYYNFLTSLSLNRPIFGGPFSISSQVAGNIKGGYGIFALYTSTSKVIIMK